MAGRLRHRPIPSTAAVSVPSATAPLQDQSASSSSSSRQRQPRKRTCAGDQLPENERPLIIPVGKQWEVHPYVGSRKVAPVQGALLKLFYPDMIGPKEDRRVATTWDDYKWSPGDDVPSAAEIIKREFWLRFRGPPEVNLQLAEEVLELNLKNMVRQMMSDIRKEAVMEVYKKESVEEEEDEKGNLWPKAEELMKAKPKDFATQNSWNALCRYWSTPRFRKKSLRGKENRLAGGEIKIKTGVDPEQIGAWHHQHRMQQGTNRALCSKRAASIWERYDKAMTEKCGENWQSENPNIDHEVVKDIAGVAHGTFAMGDGVIGPSDANSIKARKRSRTFLHQTESNPAWRAGIERVLQAFAEKTNINFNELMHPESEPNFEWCDGVERVLQAMAEIIPIDISALLHSRHRAQSTSESSGSGASSGACDGVESTLQPTSASRYCGQQMGHMDDFSDDDQISA
ncbi:hypothetical protein ACP4OV_027032 [Aristida adscensionis]